MSEYKPKTNRSYTRLPWPNCIGAENSAWKRGGIVVLSSRYLVNNQYVYRISISKRTSLPSEEEINQVLSDFNATAFKPYEMSSDEIKILAIAGFSPRAAHFELTTNTN